MTRFERSLMRTLVLFLFPVAAMFPQTVPGRYVLELSGDPAAVVATRPGVRLAARTAEFAARRAGVRRTQMTARAAVASRGGTVVESMDTVINALIVNIPDDRAAELMQVPGAVKVHAVRRVRPLLNRALPLHKVPQAWSTLPLGQNSAGAGIRIGMIDTGIDVNNPAFSDPLPAIDGFPKILSESDRQFTNAKVSVGKNYTYLLPGGGDPDANDRDGHGTGTALVAAGGQAVSPYGPLVGVAPKAYIGNYKVLGADGGTSDVIAKAIDDAVADGMDVLNLSLGGYVTSYSDIDTSEIGMAAIERAAKAGVIMVVAAGNEGPGAGTIADFASAPDAITLGAIHNDRTLGHAVTVDGAAPYQAFAGDGPDPRQVLSGTVFDVAAADSTGLACSPLPGGAAAGKVALVLRGTCTFAVKINNVAAAGALAALIYNSPASAPFTSGGSVGSATLPALFVNQEAGLDLKSRAAQDPGLQMSLDFSGVTAFRAATDVTDFSSRGPSIGSALKPDLVAVGEEIVTGAQNSYSSGESYSASGFIDTAGTSFSAPLAAGAAAVLKAARPGLTVAQYRSLLINSATRATAGDGVAATMAQGGTGLLNLKAAVDGTVAAYPTALNFGTVQGAVHGTLQLTLSNIGTMSDTYSIQAVPAGNSPAPALTTGVVQLDPNGARQIPVTLDATDLAPGDYEGSLRVSGTLNPGVITIPYWFAVPGETPAGISILYQDYHDAVRATASQAVVFRVVDIAGLPYAGSLRPQITVAGGATLRRLYRAGTIPGTYAVDIRTGTASVQLDITIGEITERVVIPVY